MSLPNLSGENMPAYLRELNTSGPSYLPEIYWHI